MTEQTIPGTEPLAESEKDSLVSRAKDLGIKNPHTMSVATLKKKIKEAMGETETLDEATDKAMSERQKRIKAAREARKLVRIACTNMNPDKKHKTHDLIKVSNRVAGTIHRAVPTQAPEEGTHVEQMLLDTMQDMKYLAKTPYKHPKTGEMLTKVEWKKEWRIVKLEPLTEAELEALKKKQQIRDSAE